MSRVVDVTQLSTFDDLFFLSPHFPACLFRGESSSEGKFVRIPENAPVGTEIFRILAYPRQHFNIQALDGVRKRGISFS